MTEPERADVLADVERAKTARDPLLDRRWAHDCHPCAKRLAAAVEALVAENRELRKLGSEMLATIADLRMRLAMEAKA